MRWGAVALIAVVTCCATVMLRGRAARAKPPAAIDTAPAIEQQPSRLQPLPAPIATPKPKGEHVAVKLPADHAPERMPMTANWPHPTTLAEVLQRNPKAAAVFDAKGPEMTGMADFKLGWLPRVDACLAEAGVQSTGWIDVDLRWEIDDTDTMWIARHADVVNWEQKLPQADVEAFARCVTKTFIHLQRPWTSTEHGDHFVFQTRVTLPITKDYIYEAIELQQ
jgi:hypothetical protein